MIIVWNGIHRNGEYLQFDLHSASMAPIVTVSDPGDPSGLYAQVLLGGGAAYLKQLGGEGLVLMKVDFSGELVMIKKVNS